MIDPSDLGAFLAREGWTLAIVGNLWIVSAIALLVWRNRKALIVGGLGLCLLFIWCMGYFSIRLNLALLGSEDDKDAYRAALKILGSCDESQIVDWLRDDRMTSNERFYLALVLSKLSDVGGMEYSLSSLDPLNRPMFFKESEISDLAYSIKYPISVEQFLKVVSVKHEVLNSGVSPEWR